MLQGSHLYYLRTAPGSHSPSQPSLTRRRPFGQTLGQAASPTSPSPTLRTPSAKRPRQDDDLNVDFNMLSQTLNGMNPQAGMRAGAALSGPGHAGYMNVPGGPTFPYGDNFMPQPGPSGLGAPSGTDGACGAGVNMNSNVMGFEFGSGDTGPGGGGHSANAAAQYEQPPR